MQPLDPLLNRRRFQFGLAAAAALGLSGCGPSNAAPASRFLLLDGSTLSEADLRGQVTLVNFWATSCVSCVRKMPDLV
ncbi:MAG: TlpA disulfide reductase family protein, partial [Serpentinimonas sp.]|nr:TlpA disulfide reductase family protein [Serpentinimonas sp.]